MNRRQPSDHLSGEQVDDLVRAWRTARAAGTSLNYLISYKLARVEAISPDQRCEAWAGIRKQTQIRLRRLGIGAPSFIWSREVPKDGEGEHLHVLAHVPSHKVGAASKAFLGWLPEAYELDARPFATIEGRLRNGKHASGALYLSKQMEPKAARERNYQHEKGGRIIGRRCGWTSTLNTVRTPDRQRR